MDLDLLFLGSVLIDVRRLIHHFNDVHCLQVKLHGASLRLGDIHNRVKHGEHQGGLLKTFAESFTIGGGIR